MHVSKTIKQPEVRLSSSTVTRILLIVATVVSGHAAAADDAGLPYDLQPGHWAVISKNTLSDVDPCVPSDPTYDDGGCSYSAIVGQRAVVDTWSSGVLATEYGELGGYIVWGGGHADYYGNEVYVFDIAQGLWKRLTDPVGVDEDGSPITIAADWDAYDSCDRPTGEFWDGAPCSRHTYDYLDYHPGTNSLVSLGGSSIHRLSWDTGQVHLLDLDTAKWRRGGANPSDPSVVGSSSAYDHKRDVFWFQPPHGFPFASYDPNTSKWSITDSVEYVQIDTVASIDPVRDLYVMLDTHPDGRQVLVHDLSNPNRDPVPVTTIGDKKLESGLRPGLEWDPVAKRFVAWDGGTDVYTLAPPLGDWKTDAWIWTKVHGVAVKTGNPTCDPGPCAPAERGTYGRWRYVPSLDAYIIVNSVDEPVFLYSIPRL